MLKYECPVCGMSIKGLTCSKCGSELQHRHIKSAENEVQVSACPKGCGKIKSPMCCGHDMEAKS
jgi:hypothetical protein